MGPRALRTLSLFLDAMGEVPDNFVVTLPKIERAEEVEQLVAALPKGRIEVMIETPAAVMNPRALVDAAQGRCSGAHFGVYDYAACLGLAASAGMMRHPACDFARNMMQVALAGSGVFLSDGVTSTLPVGSTEDVHAAWRLHYQDVRRSMANGFYQSWDLHPAQLVSRYAAVYAFYHESLEANAARLRNFTARQAKASLLGTAFDDQATVRVLEIYFARAVDSGAITREEAAALAG
jgi:citrate lyase beta subunit